MSAITTVAKTAFPIAVIGVLSGTYYYLTFWSTPPQRLPVSPPVQNASPNRLQPYQSPIQNLPSQEFNANSRPQLPNRNYPVQTTAGEFTEDQNLAQHPSAELTLDRALDDFELTIPQLQLQPPSTDTNLNVGQDQQDRAIQSHSVPVPVGSRNGQLISNPYMSQIRDNSSSTSPSAIENTVEASRAQSSESWSEMPGNAVANQATTEIAAPDQGISRLQAEPQRIEAATANVTPDTVTSEPEKQGMFRSILEDPASGNTPIQQTSPTRNSGGMRPVVPLYLGQAVTSQIQTHLDYGNSLARRSATLLAKREFTKGLRIIAEASDNQLGSSSHLRALQEGFTALREAADFDNAEGVFEFDTQKIAAAHDTPIIRDGHFRPNTPSQARKAYMLFAQDRIVQAVDKHTISAELLHALGKTYLVDAMYGTNPQRLDFARAAVLFQSSLIVNPQHIKSANELGVILARSGRLTDAKVLFQNAVRADVRFSEGWKNLAKVHQQLGEPEFAQLANQEARQTEVGQTAEVRLVQHEEFNNLSGAWGLPATQSNQMPRSNPIETLDNKAGSPNSRPSFTPDLKPAAKSERHWFQPKENTTVDKASADPSPATFKTFGGF